MNPFLELILPTLVVPLMLSVAGFTLSHRYPTLRWLLPILWLPSYFWLIGWPTRVPQEANEWLWVLLILSLAVQTLWLARPHLVASIQTGLLGLALIALAWPVLRYQPELNIVLELLAVLCVGALMFFAAKRHRVATPALTLTISSIGLALVTALGGSVLVGQLVGALASVLGAFALYELYRRLTTPALSLSQLAPLIQIYLALLVIARVYAEIPLVSAFLLLISPLIALLSAHRYAVAGSVASAAAALAWLLLTADASSYY